MAQQLPPAHAVGPGGLEGGLRVARRLARRVAADVGAHHAANLVQEAEAARTQLRAASRDKGARAPPLNIVSIGDQLFERVASHAAARVSTLSPHIVADDVCGGMSASYLHGHGMPHP